MGFYDCSCLITGVSLSYVEATAVLLRRTAAGEYQPISLGIRGAYDGYGSLEFVETDRNVASLLAFCSSERRTGRFYAQDTTRIDQPDLVDGDIESLLYLVERTTSSAEIYGGMCPPSTVLDGDPVVMAMIAQPVWDAITGDGEYRGSAPAVSAFGRGLRTATEIYGQDLDDHLRRHVRELAAVSTFIAEHPPTRWAPPGEPEQRYFRGHGHQWDDDDRRRFLALARNDFRDDARLQAALDIVAAATLD
ncbi:hypothetical protein FK535_02230 [Mycolicibacterium sp. 018/SC-01/001]|uniref:hypothetical protein n=1 Tax=Mycolicibacterium sp. 018/SC-01/001 TaxID=2592069 RepID=UPI001180EA9D|nr:hypothetical protein [Mycolicibacterium sp. 018/SC-01/001]TRW89101.1 hypothetical protein FK535_02230 [Mycolicibacterium sp. 018/SC-01/001]